MPKAASLRNLRPWKPGQSGNPNGRPRVPRFTERDQHAILTALAGAFGEGTQGTAINAMQAVLTNPRTVLKALELRVRTARASKSKESASRSTVNTRCGFPAAFSHSPAPSALRTARGVSRRIIGRVNQPAKFLS
jgi:hypothetical protein